MMFTAAGYNEKRPTIHNIRKFLGKKVEGEAPANNAELKKEIHLFTLRLGKYGSALVSQIYGHEDSKTYANDYVLHYSSINTVAAVLDEDPDKDGDSEHIEYFQGFNKYYEPGLPGSLPAEVEHKILQKPELLDIKDRITHLKTQNDNMRLIDYETKHYKKTLLRHRLFELKEYQRRWVREKRDQRILNRGKEETPALEKDVCTQALALIMPKSARIAIMMSCTEELSFERMLLFVEDLRKHCSRDFDVVYLPGENPDQGRCPVESCQKSIRR